MNELLRIEPNSDESLYSLLFRNSESYHFMHLSIRFSLDVNSDPLYTKNLNYQSNAIWQEALCKKAIELGVDVDRHTLNQFDYLVFGNEATLVERKRMYANKSTKYCRHCLKEQYYHRLKWDVNLISVCLKHKCLLIDRCPSCGKEVKLSQLMQRYCPCGHDFTKGEDKKDSAPEELIAAQEVIQRMLDDVHSILTLNNGLNLDGENYFRLFNLLSRLLDYFSGEHSIFSNLPFKINRMNYLINNRREYKQQRNIIMFSVLSVAIHRLIFYPERYFADVLKTVQEMSLGDGKGFQYKRVALRKVVNYQEGTVYLELYKEFTREVNDSHVLKSKICRKIDDRKFISVTEAKELLGISRRKVQQITSAGYLEQVVTGKTKLISRESIDNWLLKKPLLNASEVATLFGLPLPRIREMAKEGILTPVFGHNADGSHFWLFEDVMVKGFLEILFAHAIKMDKRMQWVTFASFYDSLKPCGVTLNKAFEIIKNGEVVYGFKEIQRNFGGLFVLKSSVDSYLQKLNNERIAKKGYTINDLATKLGYSFKKVKRLVQLGQIPFKDQWVTNHGTISYYFDPSEIDRLLNEGRL
ncbi:TniQ family protein [Paenibacillus cellulositrophicus]|uniref:TniQ family protein n=1 Tax=Paenibacillus cellulositrophicus TaxID=562959 RepID=UPI003F7E684C